MSGKLPNFWQIFVNVRYLKMRLTKAVKLRIRKSGQPYQMWKTKLWKSNKEYQTDTCKKQNKYYYKVLKKKNIYIQYWNAQTKKSCYYIGMLGLTDNFVFSQQGIADKKSRIRETKHLSTDADSSTDAIGGWTNAKSATTKKLFFCAAILDHFQTKMFKC